VPFGQSIVQFDIPVGPARLITVDVINQQGCIIYTGTRLPTSFAEGDNGTLPVTVKPPTRQLAPEYADEDGDGLSLCEETAFGTDDHKKDTDGDGADDFCEITGAGGRCTDPLNAQSHPPMGACGGNADAGVEP
jgi:hypothetical protein